MASVESVVGEGTCFTLTFPESMIDGAARGASMLPQSKLPVQRAVSEVRRPEAKLPTDSEYLARFVYSAAHDFNAPIVTILGHLSYLREEHAAVLEPNAISLLDYSIEASSRMGEYLRLLAQFSAVLRGRTEGELVDMNALMGEVWAAAPDRRSKELADVRWQDLPQVRADRSMLRLLLVHLLDNSLKFVETGTAPKVRIVAEDGPTEWTFSFADEGIGIESSSRESVFAPFHKQHSHSRYPGGGIGLAICQKVIEAHRGVIWIEPNEPRGVVVRFTLPKS
jgi:signal transduction histidine kinase